MNPATHAIKAFGLESQLHQTQEECAELIASISHSIRGRQSFRAIAEEVADVEIMLEQLRTVIGPDVDRWKRIKLDRLAVRLGITPPLAPAHIALHLPMGLPGPRPSNHPGRSGRSDRRRHGNRLPRLPSPHDPGREVE